MNKKMLGFALIAFAVLSSYVLAVSIVWAVVMLLSFGLAIPMNVNVWLLGLLVWALVGVYSGFKNVKQLKK